MPKKNDKWKERYDEWRQTPHGVEVACELRVLAIKMFYLGFKQYSMQALVYIVRYHRHLKHGPEDEYKINNNYVSYLARDLNGSGGAPEGFFLTRGEEELENAEQGELF